MPSFCYQSNKLFVRSSIIFICHFFYLSIYFIFNIFFFHYYYTCLSFFHHSIHIFFSKFFYFKFFSSFHLFSCLYINFFFSNLMGHRLLLPSLNGNCVFFLFCFHRCRFDPSANVECNLVI